MYQKGLTPLQSVKGCRSLEIVSMLEVSDCDGHVVDLNDERLLLLCLRVAGGDCWVWWGRVRTEMRR